MQGKNPYYIETTKLHIERIILVSAHTELEKMEAMLHQHFYWPNLRKYIYQVFIYWDNFQHTKGSNINNGKLLGRKPEK